MGCCFKRGLGINQSVESINSLSSQLDVSHSDGFRNSGITENYYPAASEARAVKIKRKKEAADFSLKQKLSLLITWGIVSPFYCGPGAVGLNLWSWAYVVRGDNETDIVDSIGNVTDRVFSTGMGRAAIYSFSMLSMLFLAYFHLRNIFKAVFMIYRSFQESKAKGRRNLAFLMTGIILACMTGGLSMRNSYEGLVMLAYGQRWNVLNGLAAVFTILPGIITALGNGSWLCRISGQVVRFFNRLNLWRKTLVRNGYPLNTYFSKDHVDNFWRIYRDVRFANRVQRYIDPNDGYASSVDEFYDSPTEPSDLRYYSRTDYILRPALFVLIESLFVVISCYAFYGVYGVKGCREFYPNLSAIFQSGFRLCASLDGSNSTFVQDTYFNNSDSITACIKELSINETQADQFVNPQFNQLLKGMCPAIGVFYVLRFCIMALKQVAYPIAAMKFKGKKKSLLLKGLSVLLVTAFVFLMIGGQGMGQIVEDLNTTGFYWELFTYMFGNVVNSLIKVWDWVEGLQACCEGKIKPKPCCGKPSRIGVMGADRRKSNCCYTKQCGCLGSVS